MAEGTIILPIAGRSSRFPNSRPKWMLASPGGPMMLELALSPLPDWRNHRVVIGALDHHLNDLGGEGAIRRALGSRPEIVRFDEVTAGPAATVAEVIRIAGITGPSFVKDCDSWFSPLPDLFDNVVCIADLHRFDDIRNIPGKSFVQLNENDLINGIAEKIVSSNFISAGGYGVRSAERYLESYARLRLEHRHGEPFVSHVISEMIARGEVFSARRVEGYQDVGTMEAWQQFRQRSAVYFVDLDGVILRNAGEYIPPLWSDPDEALTENVETVRRLAMAGAQIIFATARPERYREKTERFLRSLGLQWHSIIFGLQHGRRYVINDYAASNPYPAAVAVNLMRNDDNLAQLI